MMQNSLNSLYSLNSPQNAKITRQAILPNNSYDEGIFRPAKKEKPQHTNRM
jgi:hypothetical protein